MIYSFDDVEVDSQLLEVRAAGRRIPVQPKVLELLFYFLTAQNRGRVIAREELLRALWPGVAVTDDSLGQAVKGARRAIGDDGTSQRVIATVRGHGYRWLTAVHEGAVDAAPVSAPVPSSRRRTALVGRERHWERLTKALDQSFKGRAHVALVLGEPGIGKTRTVEELAATAQNRGACVLSARGSGDPSAPAFWPLRQILRRYVEQNGVAATRSAMASDAGALAWLSPEIVADQPLGDERSIGSRDPDFALSDALVGFLRRASKERPVVVAVDDLHEADEASALAFAFLARQLASERVFLVCTLRAGAVTGATPIGRILGRMVRQHAASSTVLRALSRENVRELVEATATAGASASWTSMLYDQSGGNPLLLHQMVELLRAEGRLGELTGEAPPVLRLPQWFRECVSGHLDPLSASCREMLEDAAALGRDFELGDLRTALPSGPSENLHAALAEAIAWNVIEEVDAAEGRYRFAHSLLRDVLGGRARSMPGRPLSGAAHSLPEPREPRPLHGPLLLARVAS